MTLSFTTAADLTTPTHCAVVIYSWCKSRRLLLNADEQQIIFGENQK